MRIVDAGSTSKSDQSAIHTVNGFEVRRARAAVESWPQVLTRRNRVTVILTWIFTSVDLKGTVVSTPSILTVTSVKCDTIIAGAMAMTCGDSSPGAAAMAALARARSAQLLDLQGREQPGPHHSAR